MNRKTQEKLEGAISSKKIHKQNERKVTKLQ